MNQLKIYSNLLAESFKDDPGIKAQLSDIGNWFELFQAQCEGEIEAFYQAGMLKVMSDGDGILIGFSDEKWKDAEFVQCMQGAGEYLIKIANENELLVMQENAVKMAEITQPDWYTKFTGDRPAYILQMIAVRPQMRGKGIFRKLIAPVLKQCEEEHMPIALQTHNSDNLEKYKHVGFEIMEILHSAELDLTCYNLLRK